MPPGTGRSAASDASDARSLKLLLPPESRVRPRGWIEAAEARPPGRVPTAVQPLAPGSSRLLLLGLGPGPGPGRHPDLLRPLLGAGPGARAPPAAGCPPPPPPPGGLRRRRRRRRAWLRRAPGPRPARRHTHSRPAPTPGGRRLRPAVGNNSGSNWSAPGPEEPGLPSRIRRRRSVVVVQREHTECVFSFSYSDCASTVIRLCALVPSFDAALQSPTSMLLPDISPSGGSRARGFPRRQYRAATLGFRSPYSSP